ncbi:Uncharacterized membrane protein YoaK, UPF0700 family [Arboricoccus pini]|uniref:Uncharacterized membrane protein YoaK, UPF0700 family n=1 Tax=Arboricoccus pini TaxID=1963835 RepID=A0A212QCW9_9PROT|nr:YoaK family protein [Arboricoccus pini]SNB57184.1 Uncharacterized membrane protein YoaK, UPF0700 family [Arboricoccus pini]
MLVREGDERHEILDLGLGSCLATVAGALNAAAFYAVGFFSANMTGNLSTLSHHLALGEFASATFYASVMLTFILGSSAIALVISAGRRRGMRSIYGYCVLLEAGLLAALGGTDLWFLTDLHVPVMVLGLAFLMGLQNAVGTRVSRSKVRTTHVSGMATDIGIELAAALDFLRGRVDKDAEAQMRNLRLHTSTLLSFLVGGILGVVVYRAVGSYLLMLCALVLAAVGAWAIAQSHRQAAAPGSKATGSTAMARGGQAGRSPG